MTFDHEKGTAEPPSNALQLRYSALTDDALRKSMDVLDWLFLAMNCSLPRLEAYCLYFIIIKFVPEVVHLTFTILFLPPPSQQACVMKLWIGNARGASKCRVQSQPSFIHLSLSMTVC